MNTPAILVASNSVQAQREGAQSDRAPGGGTVEVRICVDQYDYLNSVAKHKTNKSPRFGFCDLLSACVALALTAADAETQIFHVLHTDVVLLPPKQRRRNVHLWVAQREALREIQGSARNACPNPTFSLDQLVTACVMIVAKQQISYTELFEQARRNTAERAHA